jgi:hypothetical protein
MIAAAHPRSSSERRKMRALIYSKYAMSETRQCFEDEHRKREQASPIRRKQWSGTP